MNKIVLKYTVTSFFVRGEVQMQTFLNVYDVNSIGKKVNVTLRNLSGDVRKRFNKEDFDRYIVESDISSNRASVMFLVEDESEINTKKVYEELEKKIIERMDEQINRLKTYREQLMNQMIHKEKQNG